VPGREKYVLDICFHSDFENLLEVLAKAKFTNTMTEFRIFKFSGLPGSDRNVDEQLINPRQNVTNFGQPL
jgi:hypothetical protein